ncbi:MAG: hypothetical protein WCO57_04055 [Verrucomicrobiota bacterium]
MKHTLTGLALSVLITTAPSRAADPPATFVIEPSCTDELHKPLDAEEMQRMAAGIPPQIMMIYPLSSSNDPGFFSYRCGSCGGKSGHHNRALIQFIITQHAKFSVAGLLLPKEALGMRVLRGADGGIQQVATMKDCYFTSQDNDVIVTERYFVSDCETTAEGRMQLLPGAVCVSRCEVREWAADPAKGIRTFEMKLSGKAEKPATYVREFQETKGRVQITDFNYNGDKPSPENLTSRGTLQRVFWNEGPGYRQIDKDEVRMPDGTWLITQHSITSWRVDKEGRRHLVDTQELEAPPNQDTDDSVH